MRYKNLYLYYKDRRYSTVPPSEQAGGWPVSLQGRSCNAPTWPAPGPLGGPRLGHGTCLSALDVAQGPSLVCTAVGRGPQGSWPRKKQGAGSRGSLLHPADGVVWGRKQGGGPQGHSGCRAPSAQESRLGHRASGPNLQRQPQGSKEERPCSLLSQPGLHQGGGGLECGGNLPMRVETQT